MKGFHQTRRSLEPDFKGRSFLLVTIKALLRYFVAPITYEWSLVLLRHVH